MAALANDPSCHLVLFNISQDRDLHWILSLECFLEWNVEPVIRSVRSG
jgi:hypothetical protein